MKKLLLILVLCPFIVKAQFRNDGNVYCFKRYKYVKDGVPEKDSQGKIVFAYFYDYDMVWLEYSTLKEYKKRKITDPQYPLSQIKRAIREEHEKLNRRPMSGNEKINLIKYDSQYSNLKRFTYRRYLSSSIYDYSIGFNTYFKWSPFEFVGPNTISGAGMFAIYLGPFSYCYSFSKDLSEMIEWTLAEPNDRYYFKSLNMDDLYEDDYDFLLE